LRPLEISREMVNHIQQTLPELPHQRYERLISGFGLTEYDAGVMVEFKEMGDFFELAAEHIDNYKAIANWIQGDITAFLKNNKVSIFETKLTPKALAELVHLVDKNTISSAMAKKLLPELLEKGGEPEKLVAEKGMSQITDESAIKAVIQKVMDASPKNVEDYRAGKDKLFGFFVGQVMKETKGAANPELINKLLKEMLA
jgi:aspartyl-tRNA(Asn)/glutamyl-tRNA(Gln) amidotransferase subunit B